VLAYVERIHNLKDLKAIQEEGIFPTALAAATVQRTWGKYTSQVQALALA
jgi:hypothetical protein